MPRSFPGNLPRWWRIAAVAATWAVLFALAYKRFATYHNRTFDLAFYTRMAWGLARFDFWDPFLEAHVLGLHVSPVLLPVGWLGALLGTPATLLAAQAAAVVGAAALLGRMGQRRLGPIGWAVGFASLVAHPNLGHVVTYEAHPGTLALLPLAWALERLDAQDRRGFVVACAGVLACREDLALVVALLAAFAGRHRGYRRAALGLGLGSLAYLLLFVFVLHPRFAPDTGSFELHFGPWGDSMGAAVARWLTDPMAVLAHLRAPARWSYLPRILAPLALLPLLGWRWLLPAVPLLALNLLSHFPTTTNLDSHYLTPALPFFGAATLVGLGRLRRRRLPLVALAATLGITLGSQGVALDSPDFRWDERSAASARVVAAIGIAPRSVQAPDPLLPHLAERPRVHRAPPPDRAAELVVLDLSHRERYAHREDLLRTVEEPPTRSWLARTDYGPVLHAPPWLLLERGADPRGLLRHAQRRGEPRRLTHCLSVQGAYLNARDLILELRAHGPCPNDLAVRLGANPRPRRVDLLFEGVVSPAHLRAGDVVISRHSGFGSNLPVLYVGALRSSGTPPRPIDPFALQVPLRTLPSPPSAIPSPPSAVSNTP